MSIPYSIYPTGDHAISVSFGNEINVATNEKIMALFHQLKSTKINGVKDIIPAYTTLTIVYDIEKIKKQTHLSAYTWIHEKLVHLLNTTEAQPLHNTWIEIPVCYDVVFGIDLPVIAAQKKMHVEEIIQIHASTQYHVYMLGFLPGFAYMGTVDNRITTARITTPRTNVAAGSVGIAGNQTGIYPIDSPGGWNIIGRTPLLFFDAHKENPCLLQPGHKVKFVPVNKDEFEYIKLQHEHPHH